MAKKSSQSKKVTSSSSKKAKPAKKTAAAKTKKKTAKPAAKKKAAKPHAVDAAMAGFDSDCPCLDGDALSGTVTRVDKTNRRFVVNFATDDLQRTFRFSDLCDPTAPVVNDTAIVCLGEDRLQPLCCIRIS